MRLALLHSMRARPELERAVHPFEALEVQLFAPDQGRADILARAFARRTTGSLRAAA